MMDAEKHDELRRLKRHFHLARELVADYFMRGGGTRQGADGTMGKLADLFDVPTDDD